MGKKSFSLDNLESKITSDRTLTSEEDARQKFWTPSSREEQPSPGVTGEKSINNISHFTNISSSSFIDNVVNLNCSLIIPDPNQPRKHFNTDSLEDLKTSIQKMGVQQPITVRPIQGGKFMIVMGERRWRSCNELRIETIPSIIKEMSDSDAYLSAVTENVQREDLHFIDEAAAYRDMIDKGYVKTQGEIAEKIGVHKARISERLKLLSLPDAVQRVVCENPTITLTHSLHLSRVEDQDFCLFLARKIVNDNISVEKLEHLILKKNTSRKRKSSFKAVHLTQRTTGFDLLIKYRSDRPEDRVTIINIMADKIRELGGNIPISTD